MGSGFSSGKKTSVASSNQPVVVIDCSTDAELAATIQQSEVDARSRDLAVVAELQEMDQCIAESLIPDRGVAFELQQSEVATCNALLHEPPREEKQHAEIAKNEVQPNGGLTREQIELLPMSYYAGHGNGNNECKICFSDYKIDDLLRTLPCCHIFHSTCIDDWIKRSNSCPTCRKGIREELRIISPAPASVPRPLTPSAPPFYML